VEPSREEIQDWQQRYGYEEKEAEVAYHLREARAGISQLIQADVEAEAGPGSFPATYASMKIQSAVLPHFDALFNLLGRRVLARQFPEGWGRGHTAESQGRDQPPDYWDQPPHQI
jgi:hypothetical protein